MHCRELVGVRPLNAAIGVKNPDIQLDLNHWARSIYPNSVLSTLLLFLIQLHFFTFQRISTKWKDFNRY